MRGRSALASRRVYKLVYLQVSACKGAAQRQRRRVRTRPFERTKMSLDQALNTLDAQQALLCGHADAKREAVVPGAAMHVQAIAPARPHAVVGDTRHG